MRALLLFLTSLAPPGCTPSEDKAADAPKPEGKVTFQVGGTQIPVAVEIADTPAERTRGLMYRESLPDFSGMVFVFPHEARHSFWMKNTLIPLDMIFIDSSKKIVGIVENAEPKTLTARAVAAPSKYVVEVNGGFCAQHGIAPEQSVVFENINDVSL